MKVYWTPKQIPELRDLHKDQRKRVWRACYMTPKRKVLNLFVALTVVPVVWLIGLAKMPTWTAAAVSGLSAGIIFFIVELVQLGGLRPSIREYLKEHGHI